MATHSLNHFAPHVNQQIDSLETINDQLAQANALAQVALHEGFPEYPQQMIHHYLFVLSDIIENAYHNSAKALAIFTANDNGIALSSIPPGD